MGSWWISTTLSLVIWLFVLPILLCNQRGKLALSDKDSLSFSSFCSLTWCSGARQIRNFEFRSRECERLDQKQSGQLAEFQSDSEWLRVLQWFSGWLWVGGAARWCRFADTFYYATFELEKAKRRENERRDWRDERFIWLRGFVSSAFWRSQLLHHHHRHTFTHTYIHYYTYTQISVLDFFSKVWILKISCGVYRDFQTGFATLNQKNTLNFHVWQIILHFELVFLSFFIGVSACIGQKWIFVWTRFLLGTHPHSPISRHELSVLFGAR